MRSFVIYMLVFVASLIGCEVAALKLPPVPAELTIGAPSDPKEVPDFVEGEPKATPIMHHELRDNAMAEMTKPKGAGDLVMEAAKTKPKIEVSASEQLITQGDAIVNDPQKVLESEEEEVLESKSEVTTTQHTCEEGAAPETVALEEQIVSLKGIQTKRVYQYTDRFSENWFWGWTHIGKTIEAIPPTPGTYPVSMHDGWGPKGHYWTETHKAIPVYNFYERTVSVDAVSGVVTPVDDWRLAQADVEEEDLTYPERVKEHVSLKTIEGPVSDRWHRDTLGADAGIALNCEYGERTCIRGPETRILDGVPVTRKCWQRKATYTCQMEPKNHCALWKNKENCYNSSSRCVKEVRGKCLVYEQIFVCKHGQQYNKRRRLKGNPIDCLDGNCTKDTGWEGNQDLPEVLAKLSVFNEMQKDKDLSGAPMVFLGNAMGCTKHCYGFKDCCKKFNGWGVDVGLASCQPDEKHLAELRSKRRCVEIGFYCEKKLLRKCLRRRFTFCCFSSPLARIIQEQGRRQLGIVWGPAGSPDCRALTVDELSRLDFDRIDLSELAGELIGKMKAPEAANITKRFQEDWVQRLPMPRGLKSPDLQLPALEAKSSSPEAAQPQDSDLDPAPEPALEPGKPAEIPKPDTNTMQAIIENRRTGIREHLADHPGDHTLNHEGGNDASGGGNHAELVF